MLLGQDESALRARLAAAAEASYDLTIVDAIASPAEPRLPRALRRSGARSIIVPVSGDPTYREILHEILDTSTCPILLVS